MATMNIWVVKNDVEFPDKQLYTGVKEIRFQTANQLQEAGHDTQEFNGKDMFFTLDLGKGMYLNFPCARFSIQPQ